MHSQVRHGISFLLMASGLFLEMDCGMSNIPGDVVVETRDSVVAQGRWTQMVGTFPGGKSPGNVALLTDGTILASGPETSKLWWRFYPQDGGVLSAYYELGIWAPTGSSTDGRLFNPSFVLRDGRYLSCGGEYGSEGKDKSSECEVFDPDSNTWSVVQPMPGLINDTPAALLANGDVLNLAWQSDHHSWIFHPETGEWMPAAAYDATALNGEGGSLLLPDQSVLFGWKRFKRYLPDTDTWVDTAPTPGAVDYEFVARTTDNSKPESGPFVLLMDGRALVLGSNSHNGIYNPLDDTWVLAADTPAGLDPSQPLNHGDTPACVEAVTGNVFTVATTDPNGHGAGTPVLYEYQTSRNVWAKIPDPNGVPMDRGGNRVRLLAFPAARFLLAGIETGQSGSTPPPTKTPSSSLGGLR